MRAKENETGRAIWSDLLEMGISNVTVLSDFPDAIQKHNEYRGGFAYKVTLDDLRALQDHQCWAICVNGEYWVYIFRETED